jgi:hypothetical protein
LVSHFTLFPAIVEPPQEPESLYDSESTPTLTLTEDLVVTVVNGQVLESQSVVTPIEDSEILAEVLPEDEPSENAESVVEHVLEAAVNEDQPEIPGKEKHFWLINK